MANFTKADIVDWPRDKFLRMMADPTTRKELEDVWNASPVEETAITPETPVEEQPETPVEVTPEQQAELDRLAAEQAETDRLAAEKAETDRLAAEKVEADRKAAEAAKKKEKIIVQYQARDEQGNPIGNPTHLEADSWEEMSKKQEDAHVNAVRALQRLKTRQITQKKVETPKPTMTDEEIETAVQQIREEDSATAASAVRKLTGADELEVERKRLRDAEAALTAQRISHEFMRRHLHDFNPCEANAKIIGDFITNPPEHISDKPFEWTLDNLEYAFEQVASQLAPVSLPVVPVSAPPAPANTEASAPVVPTTVEPTVSAPTVPPVVAAAPAPVVSAPIPPAQPRKVPSSGIVPGTTAGRPAVQVSPGLTKQDIAKMTPEEFKKLIRDPKRRAEVEKVARGQQ